MRRSNKLDVFDFDGTLIRVNSFSVVCKSLARKLLLKHDLQGFLGILYLYFLRRTEKYSHLRFKSAMMGYYEKSLNEGEKKELIQEIFDRFKNTEVIEALLQSDQCIVSTAAPYTYMSRLELGRKVKIIGSLDPNSYIKDRSNMGEGKVLNLKSLLGCEDLVINSLYTDDTIADEALVLCAKSIYVIKEKTIVVRKNDGES